MRTLLVAFAVILFSLPAANAQMTAVDEEGYVTISGEIVSISRDELTIRHENGTTVVTLGNLRDDVIDQLDTSNIIEVGNIITVNGKLGEESFNTPAIEAENIYITPAP